MRISFYFFLMLLFSCRQNNTPVKNPQGYSLQHPYIINLPSDLDEISGLSYYQKDKSIFAISDETGFLYKITAISAKTNIKKWEFGKKSDFEDLVLLDSTFYILQSNGNIHVVNFISADSIYTQKTEFPGKGKNEFETLYYDSSQKKLVLLCKNCDADDQNSISAYLFDPQTKTYVDTVITLNISELTKNIKAKNFVFKASAAAENPVTGELFVLSSVNKLLLVLDKDKKVKEFYPLDPGLFKQPEGLTFSANGNMIISNEAGHAGAANILIFNYQK
ncbi:MAG: SdiA-regulated domain-containing protein [Ferruginibacter sp.]